MAARVLVTRAAQSASMLAERLRALGLDPVSIPAIATAEPTTYKTLDHALEQLDSFHWLLFTSVTGVEAFATRRASLGCARAWPAHLHVAAIGPATARAVASLGVTPSLVPPQAVAESFAEALLPHARQHDGTAARFLLIRPEEARDVLAATLQRAGAEVIPAIGYRTVLPAGSVAQLRAFLSDPAQAPMAITFTSSSTVRNLLSLCEAAGVTLPEAALRVSIGPITSQTLRECALPPHAEAKEATVDALAQAVCDALKAAADCA